MAALIHSLVDISLEKNRGVLFVVFDVPARNFTGKDYPKPYIVYQPRKTMIQWLDENEIGFLEANLYYTNEIFKEYSGEIYIDLPYDGKNPKVQALLQEYENPDETSKVPGVRITFMPLEVAQHCFSTSAES